MICQQAFGSSVGGGRASIASSSSSQAASLASLTSRERSSMRLPHIARTYALIQPLQVEDVRCATLLSELVYKAADAPDEAAFRQAQVKVEEAVGASLSNVRCHKSGGQRFLVGETEDAIYVAFQGTKSAIDWLANLNFFHGQFSWQHHQHLSSSSSVSSRSSSISSTSSSSSGRSRSSRAHIGFLKRANSAAVSISELHAAAAAAGKRLVLTGHSLGGAVAVLTTVRLLRSLTTEQARGNSSAAAARAGLTLSLDLSEPNVRCISFATPAMANSDLLQEVTAAGWDQYITNIVMPEDPVVPFVNLLLKAPPSPTQPPAISPSTFFAGLDSPSSSSSSSVAAETSSLLTRSNSWGSALTFEPSVLAEDLSASLAAADASAAAAAAQQDSLQAAAGGWLGSATAAAAAADLAMASAAADSSLGLTSTLAGVPPVAAEPSVLQDSTGSQELASWLAAARDAVKHQAGSQPSQRSFRDSSRCNSASGDSLCSLTSDAVAQWPASSSADDYSSSSRADSPAVFSEASTSPVGRTGYSFGVPVVASWALDTSSSLVFSSDGSSGGGSAASASDPQQQQQPQQKEVAEAAAAAVAAVTAAAVLTQQQQEAGPSSQPRANLGAQVAQQLRRIQQQLASTRVGRLAWISGAIAAGARCASALAAPAAAASAPHLSLLALLPRALAGPAALAVLHFVGHAAYQAALPPSHPLGQQWVMTGSGLEPVAKPLTSYPRTGEGLGLKELGGLFPGHRMIAYRRRLANLVSQSPAPAAAAEPAQQQ